jgi:hypothetical protein
LIADPWFYALAVPAIMIAGISKGVSAVDWW